MKAIMFDLSSAGLLVVLLFCGTFIIMQAVLLVGFLVMYLSKGKPTDDGEPG